MEWLHGDQLLAQLPESSKRGGSTTEGCYSVSHPKSGSRRNRRIRAAAIAAALVLVLIVGAAFAGGGSTPAPSSAQNGAVVQMADARVDHRAARGEFRAPVVLTDADEFKLLEQYERNAQEAKRIAAHKAAELAKKKRAAAIAKAKAEAAAKREAERKARAKKAQSKHAAPAPLPKAPASCKAYSGNRRLGCTILVSRGFSLNQMRCLDKLWTKESGWRTTARNPSSGAYGIPQSLPATKMESAGSDWETNPATQIRWGLGYIKGRYGTPCAAWGHSQDVGWY